MDEFKHSTRSASGHKYADTGKVAVDCDQPHINGIKRELHGLSETGLILMKASASRSKSPRRTTRRASLRPGKETYKELADGPLKGGDTMENVDSEDIRYMDMALLHRGPNVRVASHSSMVSTDEEEQTYVKYPVAIGPCFGGNSPTRSQSEADLGALTSMRTDSAPTISGTSSNTDQTEALLVHSLMESMDLGDTSSLDSRTSTAPSSHGTEQESRTNTAPSTQGTLEELAPLLNLCQLCQNQGKYQIATQYCEDCGTGANICWSCANQHKKFMELASHKMRSVMVNTCCEHTSGQHHRDSACSRDCSYQVIQDVIDNYEKARSSLVRCKKRRETDQRKLFKDKTKIEKQLQDIRHQLNQQLDLLEASAMQELHVRYRKSQEKIQQDLRALEETLNHWENTLRKLASKDASVKKTANLKSVIEDKEKLCNQTEKLMNKINISTGCERLDFVQDIKLLNNELNLTAFGKFVDAEIVKFYASHYNDFDVHSGSDDEESDISTCCVMPDGSILLGDCANTKLKKMDQVYMICASIHLPENPFHMCATGDFEVAITIPKNKFIQIVDTSNQMNLKETIPVGRDCTCVDYKNGMFYVAFDHPQQLCMYKRDGQWVKTLREYSTAIENPVTPRSAGGSKDGRDMKSDGDSNEGKKKGSKLLSSLKKKKHRGPEKQNLFETLEEILVGDHAIIYACDWSKGLVMIPTDGQPVQFVRHFKQLPMFAAKLICRGCRDDFFLYGLSEKNRCYGLLHVNRRQGVNLMGGDEDFQGDIQNVESMCYDRKTSRLILTSTEHTVIKVYEIT